MSYQSAFAVRCTTLSPCRAETGMKTRSWTSSFMANDRNLIDARFPVQYVIRPQSGSGHEWHDYRGYAGTVSGGVFKAGDEVVVLPSGYTSKVAEVRGPGGDVVAEAFPPQS